MFILSEIWFAFLIGTVAVHWLLPPKFQGVWIVLASAVFLGYRDPQSLLVLSVLTGAFYAFAAKPAHLSGKRLTALIALAGGALIAFKVYAQIHAAQNPIDLDPRTEDFIVPLGLSYYAFRCIHYAIEKYKGTIAAHGFGAFAQYLFFLPTFAAGPIHRFPAFERDLARKRYDPFLFAEGLERLLFGYVKVTFLANFLTTYILGMVVLQAEKISAGFGTYVGMVKSGLELYFQFSGYSDIAIGFAMLLGFRIMENFNFPFLAKNISEFWQRWHISLTSWCREYVYMGTVAVTRNPALGAVAAMLVMGLWHECSPRYIVWGVFQGLGIAVWQKFQEFKPRLPTVKNRAAKILLRVLSTLLTIHWVLLGILLVSNGTLPQALEAVKILFTGWGAAA